MIEELFVIKDGNRLKVDLNTPSGITLNFKSNIFGDLSKITCSYTYTFKLPLTINNRIIFESAEDVRQQSIMTRRKLTAEFTQNGIMIFNDANLYISSVENAYQAVMTWGVVRGLESLKDNDVSLRDLNIMGNDVARFGIRTSRPRPTDWDNFANYYIPMRGTEDSISYHNYKYAYAHEQGSSLLPVVPIFRIIEAINEKYNTEFYFGERYSGSDNWNETNHQFQNSTNELIDFGTIPLVKRELTETQYANRTGILKDVQMIDNTFWGIALKVWEDFSAYNVLSFDLEAPIVNNYYDLGNNGTSTTTRKYTFFKKSTAYVEKIELDGYIKVTMSNIGYKYNGSELVYERVDVTPKLIVYHRKFKLKEGSSTNGEIEYEECATLEGVFAGTEIVEQDGYTSYLQIFEFDFREENGKSRLEISDFSTSSESYPYFFSINDTVKSVNEVSDFKIIPKGNMSDSLTKGWEIDVATNLPDVSCLTFMKSLYYMIGAFPAIDSDGRIIPLYYSQLLNRKKAIDWSSKILSSDGTLPSKIAYSISGFGQNNYYLMKNDEFDKTDSEKDDVYEAGMGVIKCDNETLEKTKTIIQLPFYGPFMKDISKPSLDTGRDMKYKKYNADGSWEYSEAKPAIGIVYPIEECTYKEPLTDPPTIIPNGTYVMRLEIWNGFKNILDVLSYDTLQEIMNNPIVITENFNLNEIDLRDIDYSTPLYLNKYNSYFAIVSITRDSKGVCKCELIKLP